MSTEEEKKNNEQYSKNFTRVPNILFVAYNDLSHLEKHLYIRLRQVYWDMKPRIVSLRELGGLTQYSTGALSKMLPHLHDAGLIHAEVKKKKAPDGTEEGNPKYHITIVDIWEVNKLFYSCSRNEQDKLAALPGSQLVQEMNDLVHQMNEPVQEMNDLVSFGEQVSARVEHAKDINKDLSKDNSKKESASNVSQPATIAPDGALSLISLFEKLTPEEQEKVRSQLGLERGSKIGPPNAETISTEGVKNWTPEPLTQLFPPEGQPQKLTLVVASNEAAPKPDKPPRKARHQLTLEGQHILDLAQECRGGRKLTMNDDNIKAANGLGEVVACDEDFREVHRLIKNDPFLKEKGVRTDLDFMYRKYDGFLDKLETYRQQAREQARQQRSVQNGAAPASRKPRVELGIGGQPIVRDNPNEPLVIIPQAPRNQRRTSEQREREWQEKLRLRAEREATKNNSNHVAQEG